MQINLICPINFRSYGIASINILSALSKHAEVALWTIGGIELEDDKVSVIKQALANAKKFNYEAPSIRIFHQNSLDCYPGRGITCGFPIFELDTFTEEEKHNIAFPNKLFVCSDWAKSVVSTNFMFKKYDWNSQMLSNKMVYNTHVVPLGVDRDIFYSSKINGGATRFLNIGKLEKRKGLDILCKAFVDEFKPDENVELLLACHNPFLNQEQYDKWMQIIKIDRRIKLVPWQKSSRDIADLIRMCDCGVYPSKAEGWNMPALETLSCGRHLIITDYSAHKMYSNKDNALLIDIDSGEAAYDDIWPVFHGQGLWAKIGDSQVEQLRSHMRHIHKLKQTGNLYKNIEGCETATKFSWDNTAQKILGVL